GITRQPPVGRPGQRLAVELLALLELDGRHACPAAGAGHLDAEHRRLLDLRVGRDRGLDLGGGDVLALPPEGVAEPVGERRMPEALRAHPVAGVTPAGALPKRSWCAT